MSWMVAAVLLMFWILGMLTSNTGGGLIHGLFLIAILILAKRLVGGPPVPIGTKRDGVHRKYEKPWQRGEAHD